ncbi:hypothetical protein B484DRAFT_441600 [Ochromonadaceae sp. CCMP2298]|nr:hypothetical protein B484DRAFT_441600 [Ochromonadaceae sp. CCMP2298]
MVVVVVAVVVVAVVVAAGAGAAAVASLSPSPPCRPGAAFASNLCCGTTIAHAVAASVSVVVVAAVVGAAVVGAAGTGTVVALALGAVGAVGAVGAAAALAPVPAASCCLELSLLELYFDLHFDGSRPSALPIGFH